MSRPRIRTERCLTSKERKQRHRLNLTRRGEVRIELRLPRRIILAIDRAAKAANRSRSEEFTQLVTEALVSRSKRAM
jgi:hypothetical protein